MMVNEIQALGEYDGNPGTACLDLALFRRTGVSAYGRSVGGEQLDRTARALRGLNLDGRGLELGPSYNPLVPKASGRRIDTVDHAPREELVAKYLSFGLLPEKLDAIDEVDFVWDGGSLLSVVPDHGGYDYIIASHFIEHTVDLLGFLDDCHKLLNKTGRLALVIPDKRFTFDFFKPLTSIGSVVDAHVRPTKFHPSGPLVDHFVYASHREGAVAWGPGDQRPLALQDHPLGDVSLVVKASVAQDDYQDIHRWIFTPGSFQLMVDDLSALGFHGFTVEESHPTEGFEFFVTLGKTSKPARLSAEERFEALSKIDRELASARLDSGTEQLEVLKTQNSRLAEELAAVYLSNSWRLTRPLRILGRLRGRS